MHKRLFFIILCVGIVSIAAMLRFTNLDWDGNNRIHPDEALIVNGALKIRFFSDMNPEFHDYNGLSVYVLRAASVGVSAVTQDKSYLETPEKMTIIGRYISAIASTLTVLFIFLLTKQFFPMMIALAAGMLVAFSLIGIQLAHFYTTDSLLVLFLVLLMLTMKSYLRKPSVRALVAMAMMLGASIATKNTGYFFAPIPLLAIGLTHQSWRKKSMHTLFFLGGSLIIFFLCSPFSFLDVSGYIERSRYLQELVAGKLVFDWSMQFQHTTPLYSLFQNIWAFGPLAVLGSIGMLLLIVDVIKNRSKKDLPMMLICLWTIGFGAFLSLTYIKFIRYNAPLVVGFVIGFSYLIHKYRHVTPMKIFLYAVVAVQIIYGFMFSAIYRSPHTTFTAANWMANNVPSGATILREDWNNIIRYENEPLVSKGFHIDSINLYTLLDAAKVDTMVNKLIATDYIILDSPKVKNTVERLANEYPVSSTWYRLIENGELGFVKVAEFTSYPRIGDFAINDELSEETFTIFDHPTVRIFAKQRIVTEAEINRLLTSEAYK